MFRMLRRLGSSRRSAPSDYAHPQNRNLVIHTDLAIALTTLMAGKKLTTADRDRAAKHLYRALRQFEDACPEVGHAEIVNAPSLEEDALPLMPSVRR